MNALLDRARRVAIVEHLARTGMPNLALFPGMTAEAAQAAAQARALADAEKIVEKLTVPELIHIEMQMRQASAATHTFEYDPFAYGS